MALDELRAELQDRIRGNRTNAVIARNTALDLAKRIERDISDIRRKLEHDEVEDLADGNAIGYSSLFDSGPFNLERNLVRIVHFIGEMKVAQHDLEVVEAEGALLRLADRPLRAVVGDPVPAGGRTVVRQNPEPYIDHGFVPKADAWQYCDSTYQGRDNEDAVCGQPLIYHKTLAEGYSRCGLPREAHSTDPTVAGVGRHDFYGIEALGENCQYPVKVEDRRPDPRSHRFQGGNGSKCTYSSYGVECQGTRRDHELM